MVVMRFLKKRKIFSNKGGVTPVPMHPRALRNSRGSSNSTKIDGKSYQLRKQKINSMFSQIEHDYSMHHSEHLKEQAVHLSTMINKININHIISIADQEPSFLDMFGETEDQINYWRHETED